MAEVIPHSMPVPQVRVLRGRMPSRIAVATSTWRLGGVEQLEQPAMSRLVEDIGLARASREIARVGPAAQHELQDALEPRRDLGQPLGRLEHDPGHDAEPGRTRLEGRGGSVCGSVAATTARTRPAVKA